MYFCLSKNNNYMSLKPSKILVPIGFSEQSILALKQALKFAEINNSKVFLLTVIEERSIINNLFLDTGTMIGIISCILFTNRQDSLFHKNVS